MSRASDLQARNDHLNDQLRDYAAQVAGLQERLSQAHRRADESHRQLMDVQQQLGDARRQPARGDQRSLELRHEAELTELHAHYQREMASLRVALERANYGTAQLTGQLGAAEAENGQLTDRIRTIHTITCPDCWPDTVSINTPPCELHRQDRKVVWEDQPVDVGIAQLAPDDVQTRVREAFKTPWSD